MNVRESHPHRPADRSEEKRRRALPSKHTNECEHLKTRRETFNHLMRTTSSAHPPVINPGASASASAAHRRLIGCCEQHCDARLAQHCGARGCYLALCSGALRCNCHRLCLCVCVCPCLYLCLSLSTVPRDSARAQTLHKDRCDTGASFGTSLSHRSGSAAVRAQYLSENTSGAM